MTDTLCSRSSTFVFFLSFFLSCLRKTRNCLFVDKTSTTHFIEKKTAMQKICVKSEQLKTTRNWSGNSAGNAIQKRREVPPEQQQTCAPHTKSSSAATQKTNTLQYLPTYLPTHPPTYLPTGTHNQCFFFHFFYIQIFVKFNFKIRKFHYQKKNSETNPNFFVRK
jgi:hypothetical protein